MFKATPLQISFFPCNGKYSDKEISDLKRSWAQVIKEKVLPFLATIELEFVRFFSKTMGRPIKYISLLIVAHLFKEMNDWTDEELIESIKFDKRFEYAFDLPYHELTLCQKTLHNFRQLVIKNEMARTLFEKCTTFIVKIFNLNTSEQRLDSTHIVSNMAKLSRLGLFVRVIENFLRKLEKVDAKAYRALPSRFQDRYAQRRGYFADARSNKAQHRLGESAIDMWYLIDHFRDHDEIAFLKVMAQLERVFKEHCQIKEADTPSVMVKDGGMFLCHFPSSASLQNPSDEQAAYGHKGQGYEVAVAETCAAENPFQVITDVQTDPSNHSDQNTTPDVVDRLEKNDLKPDTMYTDGGFTSGENIVECAEKGVDLQGNLTGSDKHPDKLKLADFDYAEDGSTVIACPAGHKPIEQKPCKTRDTNTEPIKSQQAFRVYFDRETCHVCPLLKSCPATLQKKSAVIRFSAAEVASSKRRREQETEAFKERNKIRAGIESTNAELKTGHGMGKLRVRGQPRVAFTVFFKTLACNIKRMVEYVHSLPPGPPEAPKTLEKGGNLAFC